MMRSVRQVFRADVDYLYNTGYQNYWNSLDKEISKVIRWYGKCDNSLESWFFYIDV